VEKTRDLGKIALYLNEDTYRGNIHNSIGPAVVHGIKGNIEMAEQHERRYDEIFGELDPDRFISEGSYGQQELVAEDFLMIDDEQEQSVVLQSKSYEDCYQDEVKQIEAYLSYLRGKERLLYDQIDGCFIIKAHAAGIENPQHDFPQVEKGIEQEIWENDRTVTIYADIYQVEPELEDIKEKVSDAFGIFSL
jgi:hypothetical protein